MRKLLLSILVLFLGAQMLYSQAARAYVDIKGVTPHQLTTPGYTTNSTSAGLRIIPKGTYGYFLPGNAIITGTADSNVVRTAVWALTTKPAGSTAALQNFGDKGTMFLADLNGEYQLKLTITTWKGTDDTTISVYSSNWVGVGNFQGVAGDFPKCMTCHSSNSTFSAIFDKWKASGHANIFKYEIDSGAAYYSTACMKCHTTGYDHNIASNNGGFDDVAQTLGWTWYAPPKPGKWDSLKTLKPGLVNLATIGCEMCHGAGSMHASNGGNKQMIQITAEDGACAQCHDEPWRHNKYAQYENSLHSEALYESGFATRGLATTTLNDCMRCHDGRGYILFTKGLTQSTAIAPTVSDHTVISCATCHDPHGNDRPASLRPTPATSDTLGNGFKYTSVLSEEAKTCVNCHKARRDNVAYMNTTLSSTWGPHYTSQADVLLGKNAAVFTSGYNYQSSMHSTVITHQCVDCHMAPTVDTGKVDRDKVGGHTFRLRNPVTNFQHADSACGKCHGMKGSFDNFIASVDYDSNGVKESFQKEIKGLLKRVKYFLPPRGLDSINTSLFKGQDSMLYKRAYWNYQLINNDGSFGIHNPKFAIDVLSKTIYALNGTVDVKDGVKLPDVFALNQNYPNPFNPSTRISFIVPTAGVVKIRIYDALGVLIKEIFNQNVQAGSYGVTWNGDDSHGRKVASGIYIYKLETAKFNATKKMLLMK